MSMPTIFNYDSETAMAFCTIAYHNYSFEGIASCHPDDMDYESERTGCCIAEARAYIKVLRFQRDCEIKPRLAAIKHLYANMKTSKYFNPKSYEAQMVRSQLHAIEKELAVANYELAEERKFLQEYINNKDALYKRLRAKSKQ